MTCLRIVQSIWIHSAKVLDSFFKIHFESNRAKNESIGAKVESKIFKNESKTVKLCAILFLTAAKPSETVPETLPRRP